MAIAGKKAAVKVSGAATAMTNEATTANAARTEYQITATTKRVWDRSASVTVETSPDGSAWSTATGYTLDRLAGKVIFSSARPVGTQIRVSGSYLPMSTAAECYEYSYSLEADNQDSTAFGASYVSRVQGLRDVSGSLSRWYVDSYFYTELTAGNVIVLEFYSDSASTPDFKVWAILNGDEVASAVDGVVEESVEWEGSADVDGRSASTGKLN